MIFTKSSIGSVLIKANSEVSFHGDLNPAHLKKGEDIQSMWMRLGRLGWGKCHEVKHDDGSIVHVLLKYE